MRLKRISLGLVLISLFSSFIWLGTASVAADTKPGFGNLAFQKLWEYSDLAVSNLPAVGRGYTWGPDVFGTVQEDYAEGLGGKRQVEYFDKSRMELGADGKLVTNGLLTKELVTGNRQDGDNKYTQLTPSQIQVAGDDNSGDGNAIAPTYASFKNVVSLSSGQNHATNNVGGAVRTTIDHNGNLGQFPIGTATATIPTVITAYDLIFGHNIPKAFDDFMQSSGMVWDGTRLVQGKVFTDNPTANFFGYAISEAFWTKAVVAGKTQDVMVQLFERRVLTYTPNNPTGFKVEMGNIGQHYYKWRYNSGSTSTPTPVNSSSGKTVIYAALGASDVVGVGADNPTTDSWVVKISQKLPKGSTFFRLGISGAKLSDVISQLLPQAIAANPTLVTDWNVVNDINAYLVSGLSADSYRNQLDSFLNQLVTKTSAPIFIANVPDLTALPIYQKMGVPASVLQPVEQQFNNIVATEVAKYSSRVHLVDLAVWDLAHHQEWISSDGFHPSTAGYTQLAQLFLQQITALKVL